MGYQCMQGDDQEPVLLAMNLSSGETEAVCAEHLPTFFLSGLVSVTGTEWAPGAQSYTEPETGEETDEDEAVDGIGVAPYPLPEPEAGASTSETDEPDDMDDDDQQTLAETLQQEVGVLDELAGRSGG